jgi:hypothetical protein
LKTYQVTIPIAGHAFLTVEAESEKEAKEKAFDEVRLDDVDDWEALEQFNRGNVCYCPSPWEIDICEIDVE